MKSRSKKIILFFLTFLALGGVSFLLLKPKKEVVIKTANEIKAIKNPVEILDVDSDGDGLKDWEETLWKLDPKNSDTDGDGIPDSEEVKNKIAVMGVKDKTKDSINNDAENVSRANDTETDIISKKLFAEYINLKQSGNFNEEAMISTVNSLVEEEIRNKKDTLYYFLKDIKIFSSDNKNYLKSYGNSFAAIRIKYEKQYLDNPLVKEGKTANLLDPEFLQGLNRVSEIYRNMSAELSKITVPDDFTSTHLEILNNYMAGADGLKKMSLMSTDPVAGMIGAQMYMNAEEKDKKLLLAVSEYLSDNEAVFSVNETGNMWNKL